MIGEDGDDRDEGDRTRPFEWLTSPASLEPYVLKALQGGNPHTIGHDDADEMEGSLRGGARTGRTNKILHVGSGRSALGEHLALDPEFGASLVVNADSDEDALEAMRRRWTATRIERARFEKERQLADGTKIAEMPQNGHDEEHSMAAEMLFHAVEVGSQPMEFPDGHFDCAVDKGTLDCALCNHGGTHERGGDSPPSSSVADFLWEVHRLLRPDGGAYLLVTFHSVDFVRPMLLAPGLDWDVEAFVLERQTESLPSVRRPASTVVVPSTPIAAENENQALHAHKPDAQAGGASNGEEPSRTSWSSNGTFEPDESYQRTVNVLISRRRKPNDTSLDKVEMVPVPSEVVTHINAVMDEWYRHKNPMLTPAREESIGRQMPAAVPLPRGYEILFTESERAHYTYDLFLEDWDAYCDKQFGNNAPPRQDMSHDMAIHFLREMQ